MIFREELELGDKLLYTPGGVEVTVVDLNSFYIGTEDEQGMLVQIAPDEIDDYETIS